MIALLVACWVAGALPVDAAPEAAAPDAGADAREGPDAGAGADAGAPDGGPATEPAAPSVEKVRLTGRIVARGTREPLIGASVAVDAVSVTEAGDDGRFEIELPMGRHRVQIQHPGYEPVDESLELTRAMPLRLYRLSPQQTGERYETVVALPNTRDTRVVLREEELVQVPGSFGDPFRVVESLPGVSQVAWPLAIYAVRGANPGNTGFFIDGLRVPGIFHFALGPSVINPFLIKELDFFPGSYPVQYGRYVSGIASAQTANPPTDRLHLSADVRLFDAGGIAVTPFDHGQGSIAVAGRVSYSGLILSALSSQFGFSYWDYQVRIEHTLGPGKLTLFTFGSGDHLFARGPTEDMPSPDPLATSGQDQSADLTFHRADLHWTGRVLGGEGTAGMIVGADNAATRLDAVASLPISVKSLVAAPRLRYTHAIARWLDLESGADAEVQRFRPKSRLPDAAIGQDLFANRTVEQGGAYIGAVARAGSRLIVAPAMRYEGFWEEGAHRFEPSPRLNVRVRPGGETWLKASIGRYAQLASLAVQVPGFESFGLKTYGPQWSVQGSVGVETPLPGALSLDLNVFYQRLVLTDLESIFNIDPQRENIVERRDGEAYGVEVLLRRQLTNRLSGWIAYTLSKSDRLVGFYRVRAPSDWDQRHILNLVLAYRFRRGWGAGGRLHYNTGRPYPVYQASTGRIDYERLPPFFQLDWRIDKRFVFDKFVMAAYVELVNSTLSREVYDIKRKPDDSVEERGFRFVIPSLGIHVDW